MSVLVAQLYPTVYDSIDCRLPGSSVHGILQSRILEWIAIPFPGDLPDLGIESGRFFTSKPPGKPWVAPNL